MGVGVGATSLVIIGVGLTGQVILLTGVGVTGLVIMGVWVIGVEIMMLRRVGGGVMLVPHCYRMTRKPHCSTSISANSAQLPAICSKRGTCRPDSPGK